PCGRRLPDTAQPPRRLNMCPLRSSVTEAPHSRRQSVRVGLAGRTGAKSDLEICEGVPAAVAVLVEAGSVERATRDFVDRFELRDGSLSSCPHEVELITAGHADRLTVLLDGLEVDLVAVVDKDGRRAAVLTLPGGDAADIEQVSRLL